MDGALSSIVSVEWLGLAILAFLAGRRNADRFAYFSAFVFFIAASSAAFSDARPIFDGGIFAPGSWTTRLMNLDWDPGSRRLAEPSFLMLVLILACYAHASRYFSIAAAAAVVVAGLEAKALAGGKEANASPLYAVSAQIFFIAAVAGLAPLAQRAEVKKGALRGTVALAVFLALGGWIVRMKTVTAPLLTAVHFYSWFPENWKAGYSGTRLNPPVIPAAGEYNSAGPGVFERQLGWMERAGVDVIVFDWWPKNRPVRERIDKQISLLRGRKERFAILYESLALKESSAPVVAHEGPADVYLNESRSDQLASHWVRLAERYLTHENYLRVNGRPVLFVYASRHLAGPVREAIMRARRQVREKTGLDLYLVGDEVFFNVVDYSELKGVFLRPGLSPNWSRLSAFDAVTCYNPYESSRREHAGSLGAERFFADVEELYRAYRGYASTLGIEFIPGVLPGYNDRALRPKLEHFVLPRKISPGGADFFETGLSRLVRPFLGSGPLRMFAVTSWNEWNEGTQIEPSVESPPTREDDSGGGISTGEEYEGYGEKYLRILRDSFPD